MDVATRRGRPKKFGQDVIDKLEWYVYNWTAIDGEIIPSRVGAALAMGISRSTLYKWEEENPDSDFSDMLSIIDSLQEHKALNGGIAGALNPMITKLVLAKHGYHEKQQMSTIDDKGDDAPLNILTPELIVASVTEIMKQK